MKEPAYAKNPYFDPKDVEIPALKGRFKAKTHCPHCGKVVKLRTAYNFRVKLTDVELIPEG